MKQGNRAGLFMLVSIGLYLLMSLVLGIAMIVFPQIMHDYVTMIGASSIVVTLPAILMPGLLTMRKPYKRFGFQGTSIGVILLSLVLSVGVFFLSTGVNSFMTLLAETLGANSDVYSQNLMGANSLEGFLLLTLFVAVIPAVCEELFFRGALLNSWRGLGRKNAILITTVLFSLMHLTPMSLPSFLIIGYILGSLAYDSHSVLPSMLVHFVHNFITVVILCLPIDVAAQDEAALAVSPTDTIIAGGIMTALGIIITVISWIAIRSRLKAYQKRIEPCETKVLEIIEPSHTLRAYITISGIILLALNVIMLLLSFIQV